MASRLGILSGLAYRMWYIEGHRSLMLTFLPRPNQSSTSLFFICFVFHQPWIGFCKGRTGFAYLRSLGPVSQSSGRQSYPVPSLREWSACNLSDIYHDKHTGPQYPHLHRQSESRSLSPGITLNSQLFSPGWHVHRCLCQLPQRGRRNGEKRDYHEALVCRSDELQRCSDGLVKTSGVFGAS